MVKIDKKKLRDELLAGAMVIFGVICIFINLKYSTPGTSGDMNKALAFFISVCWIPGSLLIVGGIATFIEVRDTKYPRKKTR